MGWAISKVHTQGSTLYLYCLPLVSSHGQLYAILYRCQEPFEVQLENATVPQKRTEDMPFL